MAEDHQTYSRAVSISLLGLVLQGAIGFAFLLYAVFAEDHAAMTAAIYAGLGLPVWLMLAIVYDQHRRERLEAMEAEALAADDSRAASVFEGTAADNRAAARRLAGLYKWFIPAATLLIAGAMVGLGIVRFRSGQPLASPGVLGEAHLRGWALTAGLFAAFAGFVFARYVAGMASRSAWSNLRAGSAFAVGAALFGLAMAIGQFTDVAGSDSVRRLLPSILPAAMVVLGAEVVLSFLAELYRPRQKGEAPRIALDSRVLAFFAAPDQAARSLGEALDYQLGYSVQGSWLYRLMARWWGGMLVLGLVVVWLLSSLAVIQPHQRGMLLRYGEVVREDIGPGLHVKLPWPIDKVVIPELVEKDTSGIDRVVARTATGVRTIHLGTGEPESGKGAILWTNQHTKNEVFNLAQPSRGSDSASRDLALVAVEVPLQFAVSDPFLYDQLGPPGERDALLQAYGRRAVTRYISTLPIDAIIGAYRTELSEALRRAVEAAFATLNPGPDGVPRGAGVEILHVGAAGVHPPTQTVAPAFEKVVIAQTNREAALEAATGFEIGQLTSAAGGVEGARAIVRAIDERTTLLDAGAPQDEITRKELEITDLINAAGGRAASILAQARADRWQTHMSARSRLVEYQGQTESYLASPLIFRATYYFRVLADVLRSARVFIGPDGVELIIETNLQDTNRAVDYFDPMSTNPN